MSIPEPSSRNHRNGTTTTALSQANVSQVPGTNRNSIEKFAGTPAAESPYFAGARMQERSTHLLGLSNQLNAMDQILRAGN